MSAAAELKSRAGSREQDLNVLYWIATIRTYTEVTMNRTENYKSILDKIWNADPRRRQIIVNLLLVVFACASILTTRLFMYRHIHQQDISASESAFEEMYYPTLDRLYESGDLAELQREVGRLSLQEGASALVRWPHISYLQYYTQGTMVEYACSAFKDGNDTVQTLSSGVWAALTILFKQDDFEKNENFSESDRMTVRKYVDEASRLLTIDLGLTSEQIYALHDACLYDNGEVNYERVQDYITAYYENNRVFEIP